MSKWRFGCGKEIDVYIPKGWDYKRVLRECGSTAYDGGVNQCVACSSKYPVSPPRDDEETDEEWLDRNLPEDTWE
jgi:hypothetical protein